MAIKACGDKSVRRPELRPIGRSSGLPQLFMKAKGFTLIELLVVISIIGVIASIAFVSLSGQRDKAKIARSQQFSANINHALGAYAVGIWDFEDQNNPTADRSGFGNHGTLYDNTNFVDNDVLGGHALSFDGSGDYVDFMANANTLDITGNISVSLWFYPNDLDSILIDNRYNFSGNEYGYHLQTKADGTVLWSSHDGVTNANAACVAHSTGTITINQWNHITVTKSGDSTTVYFYINGVDAGTDTVQRTAIAYSSSYTTRYIGTGRDTYTYSDSYEFGSKRYINGAIDDIRIYSEALSTAQIQQHFVASAAKHGIALNK